MPDRDVETHNWTTEAPLDRSLPGEIVWWDETLRDGEQTPGVYYTRDEKVELGHLLDDIGVDIIHAGIPAVSDDEVRSVKAVAGQGLDATVIAGARTITSDIDAVLAADADAAVPFVACSDVHLEHKLEATRDEAVEMAVETVEYAVDHGLPTTFVTEDTVRADPDFVERIYSAAIDAGAERVLFCDTVGVMTPAATGWFFDEMRERDIPEDPPEWGFHNHNDFGLGTANALASLEKGVPCINTTVNGIGERAGNVAFEEVVMALETLYEHDTGIATEQLEDLSRTVEDHAGIPADQMKPVVGMNAFRHESGIHTHGVLAKTSTYEPMQPEDVGGERKYVYGKHTGSAAVRARLEDAGLDPEADEVQAIAQRIKDTIEKRGKEAVRGFVQEFRDESERFQGVSADEFWDIAESVTGEEPDERI
jgi:isopropylmalate/homocitrate/citramalate synthase